MEFSYDSLESLVCREPEAAYGGAATGVAPAAGAPNPDMELAWRLIAHTGVSVFLTGKAGTGKTTFLRRLRAASPKRMVVLAPTGVAAINAQGQTIHSFFQLPFGPIVPGTAVDKRSAFKMTKEKKNMIRSLDLLVIDEISMVRCDLLDAIDTELRRLRDRYKPFGGVQLLLIGDLQQLAPVAREEEWELLAPHYPTPYFFSSKALQATRHVTVTLRHIYRQQDARFIDILARIRSNRVDNATLQALNARCIPDFQPPEGEDWIRLTTHNRMADDFNRRRLEALPGEVCKYAARVKGSFPEGNYPADATLELKPGAQVMFIKNDLSGEHAYYNGKIGVVVEADDEGVTVLTKEDGRRIAVVPVDWQNTRYALDAETNEIKETVEGTFSQYPLRLAWAITVHKSQGLTFDHAVLDINASFAHGQAYVALSRCRTLEGMVLASPISSRSIITDSLVDSFISAEEKRAGEVDSHINGMMLDYWLENLDELFSFDRMQRDLRYLQRVVAEHLYKRAATLLETLDGAVDRAERELAGVGVVFGKEYRGILSMAPSADRNARFADRIKAATGYFTGRLEEIMGPVIQASRLRIENKQVAKQFATAVEALRASWRIKRDTLAAVHEQGFSIAVYLKARAKASIDGPERDAVAREAERPDEPKQTLTRAAGQPWSQTHDAKLRKLYEENRPVGEIARLLERTRGAITARLKKLGLRR